MCNFKLTYCTVQYLTYCSLRYRCCFAIIHSLSFVLQFEKIKRLVETDNQTHHAVLISCGNTSSTENSVILDAVVLPRTIEGLSSVEEIWSHVQEGNNISWIDVPNLSVELNKKKKKTSHKVVYLISNMKDWIRSIENAFVACSYSGFPLKMHCWKAYLFSAQVTVFLLFWKFSKLVLCKDQARLLISGLNTDREYFKVTISNIFALFPIPIFNIINKIF